MDTVVPALVCGLAVCTWLQPPQADAAPVANQPGTAWVLPAQAWVTRSWTPVRLAAEPRSRVVAWLRRGDRVEVRACQPDCTSAHAWALVEPLGALAAASLQTGVPPPAAQRTGRDARYQWGHVLRDATPVFQQPAARAKRLRTEKRGWRLAFTIDESLARQGWLQRPDGGYMHATAVPLYVPSAFAGVHEPRSDYAFVRHRVALRPPGSRRPPRDPAEVRWLLRYDREPVQTVRGARVMVEGGWLPRSAVRLVRLVQRPAGVGPADRWIHVDLSEQTLTAAIGDRTVFATLISAGKRATATQTGRFVVYAKTIHSSMRGHGVDPYFAEEVPHVLHYDQGRALHGAYWHDSFGQSLSHGCINLSPSDAAWLFDFAEPSLPAGWHNVLPPMWPAVRPVVVLVDRAGDRLTRPLASTRPNRPVGP